MKATLVSALVLFCVGCGAPEDDTAAASQALTSPLVGTWYSATAPGAEVRASVAVSEFGYDMAITPEATPGQPSLLISGTMDVDGRHVNQVCKVNGRIMNCYGFATVDGTRMFIETLTFAQVTVDSWTFLRAVSP